MTDRLRDFFQVYGNRRVLCLLGLGFSSGLPLALTWSTLQAWMATEKVALSIIGIFSLARLPYTLKFLWSPLLDRFALPWLGRRRGWIVVSQVLLAAGILLLGMTSPRSAPAWVFGMALMVAFLSASQDIVADAYRTDVLATQELGTGAATWLVGYRLAMITSGAVAMILSDHLPWRQVYAAMAALMLLCIGFTLIAPEPQDQVIPPKNLKDAVWGPMTAYFRRSGAIEMLLFIVVFKLGDVVAGAMTTPFLLDVGFTRTDVGTVNKGFGMVSTILGTLAGGSIISKLGINRSLWVFAFLQVFSNLGFTVLALLGHNYPAMITAIGIENICGGMGNAAFIAFLMSLCDKRFTATQYALLSSLMAVAGAVAGVPTGFLAAHLGWPWFFAVSVLGGLPGILLLRRFAPWHNKG